MIIAPSQSNRPKLSPLAKMENTSKNLAGLLVLSNLGDKMIIDGKNYIQMQPYGRLHTNGMVFFVFKPVPVTKDWERDERTFLCVNVLGRVHKNDGSGYIETHSVPFHVTVSGTWTLELNNNFGKSIWIETEAREFSLERLLNINEILQASSLESYQN